MIKDYTILVRKHSYELETDVSNYISLYGWQPFGALQIKGDSYYQAMVKYAQPD